MVLVPLSPKGQCAGVVWSTGRSVTKMTRFKLIWGANPSRDKRFFLFSKISRMILEPSQCPIHWAPGDLFRGQSGQGKSLNTHLPPSGATTYSCKPPILNYPLQHKQSHLHRNKPWTTRWTLLTQMFVCLYLNNKEVPQSMWIQLICSKPQTLHHAT